MINQSSTTLYKIGRAKNPKKRLKVLQTGASTKLELIHVEEIDESLEPRLESTLHRRYAFCKSQGEWFDFDTISIESVIQSIQQASNTLKSLSGENLI